MSWKQLNSQHHDKDGYKEADLRRKLIGIMSTYDLLEYFDDTQDSEINKQYSKVQYGQKDDSKYKNKSLFKDKKLNKLWEKAEVSGFTAEELAALKEEFMHHQDKVDLYYNLLDNFGNAKNENHESEIAVYNNLCKILIFFSSILDVINVEEVDRYNEIREDVDISPNEKNNNYLNDVNLVREKHRDIRDNYDRLERAAARGPSNKEFIEPRVQSLWRIAAHSNFSVDELASLKVELQHYESRLLKLRHLHAEHALNKEKYKVKFGKNTFSMTNYLQFLYIFRMLNIRPNIVSTLASMNTYKSNQEK